MFRKQSLQVTIILSIKKKLHKTRYFFPVEPLVSLPINIVSFMEGDDVTISCRVESSPKAVTTWRRVPGS